MRHFSIPICRSAIEQGFEPDTISTDIVGPRPGTVCYNLLEIMSIFHDLGMGLEQVVRATTVGPAAVIGREDLGHLGMGAVGDAAVLDIEQGSFYYEDQLGHSIEAKKRLAPVLTVKDGKRWVQGNRTNLGPVTEGLT